METPLFCAVTVVGFKYPYVAFGGSADDAKKAVLKNVMRKRRVIAVLQFPDNRTQKYLYFCASLQECPPENTVIPRAEAIIADGFLNQLNSEGKPQSVVKADDSEVVLEYLLRPKAPQDVKVHGVLIKTHRLIGADTAIYMEQSLCALFGFGQQLAREFVALSE